MDVDIRAVHMAYTQLALLHVPAVVIHGDTLSLEEYAHWHTPAHILGGWRFRLAVDEAAEPVAVAVAPAPERKAATQTGGEDEETGAQRESDMATYSRIEFAGEFRQDDRRRQKVEEYPNDKRDRRRQICSKSRRKRQKASARKWWKPTVSVGKRSMISTCTPL